MSMSLKEVMQRFLYILFLLALLGFAVLIAVAGQDFRYEKFEEPRVRQTVEKILSEKGLTE